jgi:hypothetical protein
MYLTDCELAQLAGATKSTPRELGRLKIIAPIYENKGGGSGGGKNKRKWDHGCVDQIKPIAELMKLGVSLSAAIKLLDAGWHK